MCYEYFAKPLSLCLTSGALRVPRIAHGPHTAARGRRHAGRTLHQPLHGDLGTTGSSDTAFTILKLFFVERKFGEI